MLVAHGEAYPKHRFLNLGVSRSLRVVCCGDEATEGGTSHAWPPSVPVDRRRGRARDAARVGFLDAGPTSVTVAGDLQSEAGCAGDWDPACAATHLAYDASDDVWQGTFSLPAGNYQYKAALNDSWDENYGLHAVPGGDNIPLNLPQAASVKFYYDHKTHWITDNHSTPIPVAVGDFQSELGCPGDWQPDCLRSWLEDPDGNGTATFETTALPAGSYQAKVAVNESWDENYGAGGTPNGDNIPFSVPTDNAKVTFSYDTTSHVLTISVADPQGAPGALSHFDLARKDCFGTARNTTSKVWYTVAGGVLSDVYYPTIDNTNVETLRYVVTDGATFTDVQGRDTTYTVAPLPGSGGMGCTVTTTANSGKYQIATDYITDPARNALLMKVSFKAKAPSLRLYLRFDPTVNGNGGGGGGNGGADSALTDTSTGHPILVSDDPSHRDERCEPRLRAAGLSRARRAVHVGDHERLRRQRVRRPRRARRLACAYDVVCGREQRQRRPDGAHRRRQDDPVHGRARVRIDPVGRRFHGGIGARRGLGGRDRRVQARLAGLRRRPESPAEHAAGHSRAAGRAAPQRVLHVGQRPQGRRGQDLPGRARRGTRVAVGPGDLCRRPAEHVFRLLPRGLRTRPLRDLDGPDGRRRHRDREGRDAVPLRPPAAAGRVDAAQQPRERQARTRLVRHAARRDRVPAADGGRAAPHRPRSLRAAHQARRELRRRARPGVRRRALGGAERLLALDDRGGDRRPRRGRRPRGREQ